jgi:hypothetical protein
MDGRALDYLALGILIFVLLTVVYGIIYIHDIPYEIAKKRKHPHQDAIHTAGWVSLFLMHTIWPFLWIWATVYKPEIGWGIGGTASAKEGGAEMTVKDLKKRIAVLEQERIKQQGEYTRTMKSLTERVQQLEQRTATEEGK